MSVMDYILRNANKETIFNEQSLPLWGLLTDQLVIQFAKKFEWQGEIKEAKFTHAYKLCVF